MAQTAGPPNETTGGPARPVEVNPRPLRAPPKGSVLAKSYRFGRAVTVNDPWGFGNSLEWATTCPPPPRNLDRMPRIRSERPAFEAKYGQWEARESPRRRRPQGPQRAR